MGAWALVKANSQEEAAKQFLNLPHFMIFPGERVEVMECLPILEMQEKKSGFYWAFLYRSRCRGTREAAYCLRSSEEYRQCPNAPAAIGRASSPFVGFHPD